MKNYKTTGLNYYYYISIAHRHDNHENTECLTIITGIKISVRPFVHAYCSGRGIKPTASRRSGKLLVHVSLIRPDCRPGAY